MDVHPLLVHFPIAFLTFYSGLELIRIKILTKQPYYFPLKAILLFAGVLSAIPTILAGLLVKSKFTDQSLVTLHETVNLIATSMFFVLAVCYLIIWINQHPPTFLKNMWWWSWKVKTAHILIETPVVFALAFIGFMLLTLGGALGGIIVFGPNIDPIAQFIAKFLNIH